MVSASSSTFQTPMWNAINRVGDQSASQAAAMPMNPLKIQSLLNPAVAPDSEAVRPDALPSQGVTPVSTPTFSTASSSPSARSSTTSSPFVHPFSFTNSAQSTPHHSRAKPRPKRMATNPPATATDNSGNLIIQYPPYEPNHPLSNLAPIEMQQLANGLATFRVLPTSGNPADLIANFPKSCPHESKTTSFNRDTGRDGFDLYQYTFQMPAKKKTTTKRSKVPGSHGREPDTEESDNKVQVVSWDMYNGLVKTTPFFKALNHGKTAPRKAVETNSGLDEIKWSLTGGTYKDSQGFWMPFECARALAATFCYEIRYALAPIFGPSFARECLHPSNPDFGKFLIHPATINGARGDFRFPPITSGRGTAPTIQIPHPVAAVSSLKCGRKRKARVAFSNVSPFDSDEETGADSSLGSPPISPKTTAMDLSGGYGRVTTTAAPPGRPYNPPFGTLSNPRVPRLGSHMTSMGPWIPGRGFPDKMKENRRHHPDGEEDDEDLPETEAARALLRLRHNGRQ